MESCKSKDTGAAYNVPGVLISGSLSLPYEDEQKLTITETFVPDRQGKSTKAEAEKLKTFSPFNIYQGSVSCMIFRQWYRRFQNSQLYG
jgi:hypothetical protein